MLLAAATVSPAGCAEATCNLSTGLCEFRARDLDNDGERAASCTAGALVVTRGPDCDDSNATVKAGFVYGGTYVRTGGTARRGGGATAIIDLAPPSFASWPPIDGVVEVGPTRQSAFICSNSPWVSRPSAISRS